jgi:isoleucyl-tRNA synthetase
MAQGYKEISDTSVYIKFKLKNNKNTYILSWTTTPWTLPGNVALAVGKDIDYVAVKTNGETFFIAKSRLNEVLKEKFEIKREFKGSELVGLEYEPLFDVPALKSKASYKIYDADFVTTTDGTGVVHTAVMYGEDDYNLGKEIGLPQVHTVDERGRFTKDVKGFEGMFVKAKEMEDKIIRYLADKNYLLKTENYVHEYPFCWRCGTPLIYYARDSWFIAMSKLRAKLLSANEKINWVPENIKEGRFGEWLKEVKDWAVSRERYWGTPLPVWTCNKCGHQKVVGSMEELENLTKAKGSKNRYILVRHGVAESNLRGISDSIFEKSVFTLTLDGRLETEKLAKKLKKEKIDEIFSSDFPRTKETAGILKIILNLGKIHFDPRLREINIGDLNGRPVSEYHAIFKDDMEKFVKRPPGGENLSDMRTRLFDFVKEKEKEFSGKTILIVSHEYPIWMLASIFAGWGNREAMEEKHRRGNDFIANAAAEEYIFRDLPRNETGEADLHKPYVDLVKSKCERCGLEMERVKEVLDVWFDSGAMPFAQSHWPFNLKIDYPADYISEAIDQTRGWFYTLLAIGILMGKKSPFKNVMCLGLVLDKNGQKMSKSKGNIVDPWEAMNKYGADAVRWYFYTVNPPGEPKRFDEAELLKTSRQFFSLLYNSFVFFDTYKNKDSRTGVPDLKSVKNILDRWILSRLNETIVSATDKLNAYGIGEAGRAMENFVGDLSRWYIRRSRRRFQRGNPSADGQGDFENASNILGYVLLETSKLIAPLSPFFGEALYKSLSANESVHLENWPKADKKFIDKKLSAAMEEVRNIASAVLAKRAELGIKVRQPLPELKIKNEELKGQKEILDILKDEVNVKEIKFDAKLGADFELDTNITHELKEEGILRELIRTIQDLRQDAKLKPQDVIELFVDGAEEIKFIVSKNAEFLKKEVKAKTVDIGKPPRFESEIETKIDGMSVWIGLKK